MPERTNGAEQPRPIRMTFLARVLQALGFVLGLGAWVILGTLGAVLISSDRSWEGLGLAGILVLVGGLSYACFRIAAGLLGGRLWSTRRRAVFVLLFAASAGFLAVTSSRYGDVQDRARFAADQGTIATMRSAIAIYYGQHGTFPDHPGHYVNPSPPNFVCVNVAYVYSPTTGEIKITSTNTVAGCP